MASSAVRAHARTGRNSTPPTRNTPSRPSQAPEPLPERDTTYGHRYNIAQRVQCLTLQTEEFSKTDIEKKTGIKRSVQTYMRQKTFERGFRPDQDLRILDKYVEDKARLGRPKEKTLEIEQALLENVKTDRTDREKLSKVLVYKQNISYLSTLRILYKHDLSNVKPTRKPGLNTQQRTIRLVFCLKH